MKEAEKLQILLDHWIEHNSAHEEEFERWVEKARQAGLEEVSHQISGAAESLRQASRCLRQAQNHLDPDSEGGKDVSE